jgi:hypothetical protein
MRLFRLQGLFLALSFLAVAFLLGGDSAAWGQSTSGNVVGVVLDKSGAAIPGATVTAKNEATGVASTVEASKIGDFRISNLLEGKYSITASAQGFATLTLKGFDVQLNKTSTATLVLPVHTAATNVEVSAEAPAVLDTTTTQLQASFETEELAIMPTANVGAGVLNLSLLVSGVAGNGGMGDGIGPSVGGMRSRSNNYTIEGIDNNNKSVTGPLVYIPASAVGEFTVITNQFSPEFGHSVGGQFNTVIVSGGNKIHGAVYEYMQNRNLNAENAIQGGKISNPRYDNNRFGGQVGGPIKKDKLFYFASYERNPVGQSGQYWICTPTAAGLTTLNNGSHNFNANNLGIFTKYMTPVASATQTNGGTTGSNGNDLACGDGPGPQYAPVFSDGVYNSKTGIFGTANEVDIPLGNYSVVAPNYNNFEALTTGGNWTISSKDSFRLRYIYNNYAGIDTAASLPAFYMTAPDKYHLVALSEYHSFTSNLSNEARLGFNRFYSITSSGNFSYPGLNVFPNLTLYDIGAINIGPDGNAPQETIQNTYQFTDNVSYEKGKHSLKFGFDGRKFISPQSFTQRVRGDYEWDYTTEYLHDLAPTYFGERSTGNFIYYGDQTAFYGFGNDVWHVLPKLSLNFGLRYEFTSVPKGERSQDLNSAASVPGLIVFSAPKPQYTNLMPRFGINYAPNQNTSIRAGFGMGVDVLYDNLGILSSPPQFSATNDVGSGTSANYGDPGFLAGGGLPAGGNLAVYCKTGTGAGTGKPCVTDIGAQRAATAAYIPDQKLPYAENWSLGIQHVFHNDYTAEVRYLGNRGIHLATQIQLNIQPEVTAATQLPTYISGAPGAGTLAALPNTLATIKANPNGHYVPKYLNLTDSDGNPAGFTSKITSYQPWSESNYNGLAASLNRRFKNGLLLDFAYTWSKTMDDATATVNSTSLTPRRPQNSQDLAADYSRSALDRTHRITLAAVYDLPFFKTSNWLEKNLIGNWEFAPSYTYESPEYFTVLSGDNSNLNGEGGGIDRTIINSNGIKGTGTAVKALYDPSRASLCGVDESGNSLAPCDANLVAYQALDATARYVQAAVGTLPTSSRNTEPTRPTNNFDATASKKFNFTERYVLEFSAQAFNALNHSQFTPGTLDNVNSTSPSVAAGYQEVAKSLGKTNGLFNQPGKAFNANARTMQLSLKLDF